MDKGGFSILIVALLASTALGSEPRAVAAVALAYDVTTVAANVVDIVPSEPAKPQPTPEQPEIDYTKPVSYKVAHESYTQSKRPMVVMVTASWCPYCPAVKSRLTEMARHGEMADASLVVLDYDHDEMGRKVLPRGGSLPYVAVYFHNRSGKEDVKRRVSTSQIPTILGTR